MGFFDKIKKTAQAALQTEAPPPAPTPPPVETVAPREPARGTTPPGPVYTGPVFRHGNDVLPQPPGWDQLSIDDWFFKLQTLLDRVSHADEEDLEPMFDADGEPLDPEQVVLRLEGFTSGGHYEKFRTWGVHHWAAQLGEDPTDLEFRLGSIARERILANQAAAMSVDGGPLSPVEGISCETWAHINAALANGGAARFDALLANAGMDRPKWDRVGAEFIARMTTDRTGAIATVYGAAFAGSGEGQFAKHAAHAQKVGVAGDLSDEPMPYERYCEIIEAQAAAAERGEDVNEYLPATFGLTAVELGHVGAFWSKKTQQDASAYYRLNVEYSAKYKAQYAV